MLSIKDLHANIDDKEILKGINLEIKAGEVHAIMGPNGSGKSTLSAVLAGREEYEVTKGEVSFGGSDILEMNPEDRAREGLFLAFQYPIEIPGVSNINFLKTAINETRAHKGVDPITAKEFLGMVKEKSALVELDAKLASRSVNEGFSGGEKKRNEIFQMAMLAPKLSILDETDSGLDIDAVQSVAQAISKVSTKDATVIIITHYARILNFLDKLDYVHVFAEGKVLQTGDASLAQKLEAEGYEWALEKTA